jgi:hypothetical protein
MPDFSGLAQIDLSTFFQPSGSLSTCLPLPSTTINIPTRGFCHEVLVSLMQPLSGVSRLLEDATTLAALLQCLAAAIDNHELIFPSHRIQLLVRSSPSLLCSRSKDEYSCRPYLTINPILYGDYLSNPNSDFLN